MPNLYQSPEIFRIIIESRIIIKWFESGETDIPNVYNSRHVFMPLYMKNETNIVCWNHYFILESDNRNLAVYRIDGLYRPRLHRLRMVPAELLGSASIGFEEFISIIEKKKLNRRVSSGSTSNSLSNKPDSLFEILDNAFNNNECRISA